MSLPIVGHDAERDLPTPGAPGGHPSAPGMGAPLRTRPIGVEDEPRTRAERVRRRRPDSQRPDGRAGRTRGRRRLRWDLLEGRKALIFGVANERSIAWGIAQALHARARTSASLRARLEERVRPSPADRATFVEPCDVAYGDIDAGLRPAGKSASATLDVLVHAIAFAKREELEGSFVDTSRDGFRSRWTCAAYSLVALARGAGRYGATAAAIMTLTYYGAEKVVANYNVMGVAKAALEASVRYLAADLGPDGIRVNAISAGPIRTLAASGVAGFKRLHGEFADGAAAREHHARRRRPDGVLPRVRPVARGDRRDALRGRWLQHPRASRREADGPTSGGCAAGALPAGRTRLALDGADDPRGDPAAVETARLRRRRSSPTQASSTRPA